MAEIADMLSSVACEFGDSTLSSLLEILHSRSFDLKVFKNHVRCCNDCRDIAYSGAERSILQNKFENN